MPQVSNTRRRAVARGRPAGRLLLAISLAAIPCAAMGVEPRSIITTVAEGFNFPEGVAVTANETIYISLFNHGGAIFSSSRSSGTNKVVAGTFYFTGEIDGPGGDPRDDLGDGGPAVRASVNAPFDVAVDRAGNLFIADTENDRVRRVDSNTGIIETVAGTGVPGFSGDGGPATQARLDGPMRLIVDVAGNLYIAERDNSRVRRVDAVTGIIQTVAGGGTSASCSFEYQPALQACLGIPFGVALDGAGNLYIAQRFGQLRRVDAATGLIHTLAGTLQSGSSGDCGLARLSPLELLGDVASDAVGNLYFSEEFAPFPGNEAVGGHRIRRLDASTGIITTVAGTGFRTGSIDGEGGDPRDDLGDGGPAKSASLANPSGLELGPDGILYVADRNNLRIRAISLGADATPDQFAVSMSPRTLWPPNHRMVTVEATLGMGACFPVFDVKLVSVSSDEPDDAPGAGDGNTRDDIRGAVPGTPDFEFELRAERDAAGPGRVYTVVYSGVNAADDTVLQQAEVIVPHDRFGTVDPVAVRLEELAAGTEVSWDPVDGASSYDVVRGNLDAIADGGDTYALGDLTCVEVGSLDASTAGHEDTQLPAPGKAFFYLVSYLAEGHSGFGAEDAGKPRDQIVGGCR